MGTRESAQRKEVSIRCKKGAKSEAEASFYCCSDVPARFILRGEERKKTTQRRDDGRKKKVKTVVAKGGNGGQWEEVRANTENVT